MKEVKKMNTWTDEHTIEFMNKAQKLALKSYAEAEALNLERIMDESKAEENNKKISQLCQEAIVLKKITILVLKANALWRIEQMGL